MFSPRIMSDDSLLNKMYILKSNSIMKSGI
jgi:hypothetical protein